MSLGIHHTSAGNNHQIFRIYNNHQTFSCCPSNRPLVFATTSGPSAFVTTTRRLACATIESERKQSIAYTPIYLCEYMYIPYMPRAGKEVRGCIYPAYSSNLSGSHRLHVSRCFLDIPIYLYISMYALHPLDILFLSLYIGIYPHAFTWMLYTCTIAPVYLIHTHILIHISVCTFYTSVSI